MVEYKITDLPTDFDELVEAFETRAKSFKLKYPNFLVLHNGEKKNIFISYLLDVLDDIKNNRGPVTLDDEAPLSYYKSEKFRQDLAYVLATASITFNNTLSYLPDFNINYKKLARDVASMLIDDRGIYSIPAIVKSRPDILKSFGFELISNSLVLKVLSEFYNVEEIIDIIINDKVEF